MTTRIVETEHDRTLVLRFIEGHDLPFTVKITKAGKRSVEQNRLQFMWMNEIAEQKGDLTPAEVRAYCKLAIGVPILCEENEEFRAKYDAIVRPLEYEHRLALMGPPLDFPITSLMNTRQMTKYLDQVQQHFAEKGYVLTDPGDLLKHQSEAPPPPVDASETPANQPPAGEEGGDRPTSPSTHLMEFAGLCYRIVADEQFPTNLDTFTDAVNAFEFRRKSPSEYDKAAAIVASYQAVINGKAELPKAADYIAEMLGCEISDFEKKELA
jgi:hypothetical protein